MQKKHPLHIKYALCTFYIAICPPATPHRTEGQLRQARNPKSCYFRVFISLSHDRSASVASTHVSYTALIVVQEVKTLTFHLRTASIQQLFEGGFLFCLFSFKSVAARSVVYVLHYYKRCKKKILLLPVITAGNVSARVQTNNTEFLVFLLFFLSLIKTTTTFFPRTSVQTKTNGFLLWEGEKGETKNK